MKLEIKKKLIANREQSKTTQIRIEPNNSLIHAFDQSIVGIPLPQKFTNPFDYTPHPLCVLAAEQLQRALKEEDWEHNFGLTSTKKGRVLGKMFGVLVVKNQLEEINFLVAFSGKLTGKNNTTFFVPSLFQESENDKFIDEGMENLTKINHRIENLQISNQLSDKTAINELKILRKKNSNALQNKIFSLYHFLNQKKETKNVKTIFWETKQKEPPSGAGECAAPKLLQFAFQNELTPLAMAEFWWGAPKKTAYMQHGQFYPACQEKCLPILTYMLSDIALVLNERKMTS